VPYEPASRSTTGQVPHKWVVAADVRSDESVARIADFRGSFKTKSEQRTERKPSCCRSTPASWALYNPSVCVLGPESPTCT
jgi:hypothetical protein